MDGVFDVDVGLPEDLPQPAVARREDMLEGGKRPSDLSGGRLALRAKLEVGRDQYT